MSTDFDKAKASRQPDAAGFSRRNMLASDTFWITLLTLLAFSARLWDIGGKGLWYDEASTALMARAGVAEIVQFHTTRIAASAPSGEVLLAPEQTDLPASRRAFARALAAYGAADHSRKGR